MQNIEANIKEIKNKETDLSANILRPAILKHKAMNEYPVPLKH